MCDIISDSILDAYLKVDENSRVACETVVKDNMVMVFGEITSKAYVDIEEIVRKIDKTIDKVNLYCIVEKNDWWNKEKKSWLKKKTRYSLGEMRNGKIVHIENVKNTEFAEAIFRKIEKNSKKEIKNGKRIRAVIAHGDNLEEAEKLKKLLKIDCEN